MSQLMDSLFIDVPFDSMSSVTRRLGAPESSEEIYRTARPRYIDPLLHRQIMRDMIYRVLHEKNKISLIFFLVRKWRQHCIASFPSRCAHSITQASKAFRAILVSRSTTLPTAVLEKVASAS
jgi:hypothetical protein